jgi:glycosyltransferase involved in cell wall biosynthesis
MLAPIWERVPPVAYGGIELVVSLLTEGLAQIGHDVTLFATGDSATAAHLFSIQDKPLRGSGLPWFHAYSREIMHVTACFDRAGEFDLIHNHAGYQPMVIASYVNTPVLTTLHGPFEDNNRPLFEYYKHLPYVSISDAQRQGGPALNYQGTVYNGIDTGLYALAGEKGGYLLNLGRISPEKGTHLAIEAARLTGIPLIIAGKVDPVDTDYYETLVKPHIDGTFIRYIGEVSGQPKADLLAQADVLLHPVQWPEPFGLVMAEAMAAGTPVVAYSYGSIPEVVEDGLTGYIVNSMAAMVAAIDSARSLDPARCRNRAIERFDAWRMVADYLAVYEAMLETPELVSIKPYERPYRATRPFP